MRGERQETTPGMETPWTPAENESAGSAGARRKMPEMAGKQRQSILEQSLDKLASKWPCLARETPQSLCKNADAQAGNRGALFMQIEVT